MYSDTGRFATPHASKYLQQLCKHFAHKVQVSYDENSGRVEFPFGHAELGASETGLQVEIHTQDADTLARGRAVIDKHLERFAFRESFQTMDWDSAGQADH